MIAQPRQTYNVQFDPSHNWVTMKWEGYITSAEFREGTELMLNLLIKNNAHKVLADVEHMLLIDKEDQEWLINYFLPRAFQFGFRAIALVKPVSTFNLAAIENISSYVNENININLFRNIEEASEWLKQIDV